MSSNFIDCTLQGAITYSTKREVRKIIDSKVAAGMGYVSSQEGRSVYYIYTQSCHGQEQHIPKNPGLSWDILRMGIESLNTTLGKGLGFGFLGYVYFSTWLSLCSACFVRKRGKMSFSPNDAPGGSGSKKYVRTWLAELMMPKRHPVPPMAWGSVSWLDPQKTYTNQTPFTHLSFGNSPGCFLGGFFGILKFYLELRGASEKKTICSMRKKSNSGGMQSRRKLFPPWMEDHPS